MHGSFKIIGLISLVLASFATGVFVAAFLHLGSPIVTVKLHNTSDKEIASLQLVHEHGLVEVKNLEADGARTLHFYSPAESSYELKVVFTDGRSIEGGAGYVEAGYTVTETISESEIKSDIDLIGYRP